MSNSCQALPEDFQVFPAELTKLGDVFEIFIDDNNGGNLAEKIWRNPTAKASLDATVAMHLTRELKDGDGFTFLFVIEPTLADVLQEAVALSLSTQELRPECSSAIKILRLACLILPHQARERYLEEFRGELLELSWFRQLCFAASIALGIVRLRQSATQLLRRQG